MIPWRPLSISPTYVGQSTIHGSYLLGQQHKCSRYHLHYNHKLACRLEQCDVAEGGHTCIAEPQPGFAATRARAWSVLGAHLCGLSHPWLTLWESPPITRCGPAAPPRPLREYKAALQQADRRSPEGAPRRCPPKVPPEPRQGGRSRLRGAARKRQEPRRGLCDTRAEIRQSTLVCLFVVFEADLLSKSAADRRCTCIGAPPRRGGADARCLQGCVSTKCSRKKPTRARIRWKVAITRYPWRIQGRGFKSAHLPGLRA